MTSLRGKRNQAAINSTLFSDGKQPLPKTDSGRTQETISKKG
eukprot:COSAG06_NODE_35692_length_456_cov_2.512605_1_plen_41_part_01